MDACSIHTDPALNMMERAVHNIYHLYSIKDTAEMSAVSHPKRFTAPWPVPYRSPQLLGQLRRSSLSGCGGAAWASEGYGGG